MRRKTAGRVAKPKECALCGSPMMGSRPVVLLTMEDGTFVGPYHFGCAQKMVLDSRSSRLRIPIYGQVYGKQVPEARQETLPW